jgi:hypothetical protein
VVSSFRRETRRELHLEVDWSLPEAGEQGRQPTQIQVRTRPTVDSQVLHTRVNARRQGQREHVVDGQAELDGSPCGAGYHGDIALSRMTVDSRLERMLYRVEERVRAVDLQALVPLIDENR